MVPGAFVPDDTIVATLSIPANIAEGFARRGSKNKVNFYNISQGSLNEVQYYVRLINDLGLKSDFTKINNLISEIGKMLNGLITVIDTTA